MKHSLIFLITFALSTPVLAHLGTSSLVCKSSINSGTKQSLDIFVKRANGIGWGSPIIEVTLNGKKIVLNTPDDLNNYGETFHNSPLGVIRVTVIVPESEEVHSGVFSVVALPQTVEAFDQDGKLLEWSLEAENNECYDVHGKASFQGVFRGHLQSGDLKTQIDAQVMDCTLTYNPGKSC